MLLVLNAFNALYHQMRRRSKNIGLYTSQIKKPFFFRGKSSILML